ncbi:MAG TPA: TonB family protein [Polyangiaceae bacterium]|nr:TonB family protein [Polyangiaceae bacterium]
MARAQANPLTPAGQAGAAPPAPDTAPPVPVVPPSVKKNVGAEYPRQAIDEGFNQDVEITLQLTIDDKGVVTKALVETPVGHGFDEAAIAAAQKLEFDPARRGGKPVAARIRFTYRFSPPAAILSGRVLTAAGDRPIAGATVVARTASGEGHTATTGADGSWRIEGLPAGSYHLVISAQGMAPHEADQSLAPAEEAGSIDRLAPQAPAATTAAPKPDEQPVEEVEVRGVKPPREVVKRTLEQREIDRIPGTGGDALRSLQYLPGVARAPGFAGLLIVRGSAPQDSQYFIDGTPVPIVYHFGGLSSVVPTEILDRIDFYPGNFSAQYGRAMGGIVDVGLADPKGDRLHGMAEVNLIDARVLAQGPLFDTGWKFTLGGRRSWFDAWLGPVLTATGANVSVAPVYYDYQGILERDLGKRSSIRFAVFGSDDRLQILLNQASAAQPALTGVFSTHTGFWRAQGIYKNRFSDDTEFRLNGAFGQDYVDFSIGDLFFNVTQWPITSRAELAQKIDPRLTMNVGIDLYYAPYTLDVRLPPLAKPGQPPPGPFSAQVPLTTQSSDSIYQPALYTEWEATPWKGTRIVPGLRLDYTQSTKAWDFDPRILVRQDLASSPRTTIKGGIGAFSQPPQPQETNAVFGMSGLSDNRSIHYDVGVEHEFTKNIEASLDGFYKQLDNLVVVGRGNTGSGVVYGGETLIKYKPDDRFFGWLSYTLSRSLRRDAPGLPLRLFQYDETHVLNVVGSYKLGRGWEFGAAFRLISGYMYTPDQYGFYDENIGTNLALAAYPRFGSRLPLFQTLNLRVDKIWKRPWGTIDAFLDVINVYNAGNVDGIGYDYNFTHTTYVGDIPFLPSLGLRVEL